MKGSYTVEAALLMTVLIPVLMGIIYLGFYLHNSALLKNAAYETAVYGSLCHSQKESKKLVEKKKEEAVKGRLLGMQAVSGNVEIEDKKISVVYSGQMKLPGFTGSFFGGHTLALQGEASLSLLKPGKTVLRLHSLNKVVEEVKK